MVCRVLCTGEIFLIVVNDFPGRFEDGDCSRTYGTGLLKIDAGSSCMSLPSGLATDEYIWHCRVPE